MQHQAKTDPNRTTLSFGVNPCRRSRVDYFSLDIKTFEYRLRCRSMFALWMRAARLCALAANSLTYNDGDRSEDGTYLCVYDVTVFFYELWNGNGSVYWAPLFHLKVSK